MLKRSPVVAAALLASLGTAALGATDLGYDPNANAFELLEDGVARARGEGKLVLLISGGDWCVWCHYLNEFVKTDADVQAQLHETFAVVKIYVGDENYNKEFFAQLPAAAGAPHFWIFSASGELLGSQETVVLEDGNKSYDKEKFLEFIRGWRSGGHR